MLQRFRPGVRGLIILLVLMAVSPVGFQVGNAGAQVAAGGDASSHAAPLEASASRAVDCGELAALVQQERSAISREMGQIKREIAALRDDLSKPGLKEIFAGIGYIFGLAGIGFYFHCRKWKAHGDRGDPGSP